MVFAERYGGSAPVLGHGNAATRGIRIARETVQATLVDGEGMDMRIVTTTGKLAPGATLEVSI